MSCGSNPDLKAPVALGIGLNNREAGQLFVLHSKWWLLICNTVQFQEVSLHWQNDFSPHQRDAWVSQRGAGAGLVHSTLLLQTGGCFFFKQKIECLVVSGT